MLQESIRGLVDSKLEKSVRMSILSLDNSWMDRYDCPRNLSLSLMREQCLDVEDSLLYDNSCQPAFETDEKPAFDRTENLSATRFDVGLLVSEVEAIDPKLAQTENLSEHLVRLKKRTSDLRDYL